MSNFNFNQRAVQLKAAKNFNLRIKTLSKPEQKKTCFQTCFITENASNTPNDIAQLAIHAEIVGKDLLLTRGEEPLSVTKPRIQNRVITFACC